MSSLLNQPEYEAEDTTEATTAVAEQPAVQAVKPEVATSSNVPALVSSTAVGAARTAPVIAFSEKANAFDNVMASQLALGAYRIKGEQGKCYHENEDLGEVIRFQVVSFNDRWAIGTGSQSQTSEDKARFRVSYDGIHIDGEPTLVEDYINGLKAEGYTNAKASTYIDLWGFVTWTKTKGEIPVEERDTIAVVQLSQTSAGNWRNFCVARGMLEQTAGIKMGDEVEIVAQAQAKGSNRFTNFSIRVPKKH